VPHLPLVLASQSPRRRRLLQEAGLQFEIRPADLDETPDPSWAVEEVPRELALRKAQAVAAGLEQPALVLGSDTVVVVGEGESAVQLGKPADAVEAAAMLARLSGTRHRVLTGVAVVEAQGERSESAVEVTWVTMRHLSAAEQAAYVATGEWQDKAGGYAIQESADAFVTSLEGGGFDNVVGLPVPLTLTLLERMGFSGLAGGGGRQ